MPEITRPLLTLAMPTLYVIPNWDWDFENSKSRTIERTTFFCVQNHFDGLKIRRLQNHRNALELYGAFHAICGIASKCWYRGVLLDLRNGPLGALDIAAKTGFNIKRIGDALTELEKPGIGLLRSYEIEFVNGNWVLPEPVLEWAVPQNARRKLKSTESPSLLAASHRGLSRTLADSRGLTEPQTSQLASPSSADSGGSSRTLADSRGLAEPPESAKASEQKGREEKSPLPSPRGDEELADQTAVTDYQDAKSIICKKILGGKNPSRLWSPDAEARLAELVAGGLPRVEIDRIGWFRGLAKSDDIPELKARRDPITETTLMNFWGDEFGRADAYWKKNHGAGVNGSEKKEPARWMEFFRWKYGEDVVLPSKFSLLGADQRREWEREHEEFEQRTVEAAAP
jgi:hypothetical protein